MQKYKLKYGNEIKEFNFDDRNLLGVIQSKDENTNISEIDAIINALENPIGTDKLSNIVNKNDKVCVVISDITRVWQKMSVFLPYIVKELKKTGIEDENIIFISATGSHRKQSDEEHRALLGEELYSRFEVIDHDSRDEENLIYVGTTSFGTPVKINKMAYECEHIIITGAVVFHDLAGWGGGKKSILPGIAGYDSIMKNHSLSLNPKLGEGINPFVRSGNFNSNPLHEDMLEATQFVKPSFMFNVLINSRGDIGDAVAGHYIEAHNIGAKKVDEMNRVKIEEKADVLIVSAGGYPKDINLYQASKALINAKEAVKDGGDIIIVAECSEGVGNKDIEELINISEDNSYREKIVRESFTVAKFIGYLIAHIASKFNIILISSLERELLKKINIQTANSIDEALDSVYAKRDKAVKTYIIPQGCEYLPSVE